MSWEEVLDRAGCRRPQRLDALKLMLAGGGLPLNAYLLLRVGVVPAFFEELVEMHLEKGDTQAALVTADRACRAAVGWARPQAMRAILLDQLGKPDQARDAAVAAMADAIWTLGMPFERVAKLAGWREPISGEAFRKLVDADKPVLDRAAHLMDWAAATGRPWDSIRDELAGLYAEVGLDDVAWLVRA